MSLSARILAAAAAVLWCVFVIGISVNALTVPVYTSAMTQALGVADTSGLSSHDVLRLSARVRDFVSDDDAESLPATWRGRPGFDRAAVSHLLDVRAAIRGGRIATGAAALALAAFVAWCVVRRRTEVLSASMRWGAAGLVVSIVVALAAGTVDFDRLFAFFHGLFFAAGTWTFPYDSLLIRLFPERFWVTSGAAWGALCGLGAVVLGIGSRLLRQTAPR